MRLMRCLDFPPALPLRLPLLRLNGRMADLDHRPRSSILSIFMPNKTGREEAPKSFLALNTTPPRNFGEECRMGGREASLAGREENISLIYRLPLPALPPIQGFITAAGASPDVAS